MAVETVVRGNAGHISVIKASLTPVAVTSSNSSAEQSFTIPGLLTTDVVEVNYNGVQTAGIGIANTRVSASGTLTINFSNSTVTTTVTPASGSYLITLIRAEGAESLPANAA